MIKDEIFDLNKFQERRKLDTKSLKMDLLDEAKTKVSQTFDLKYIILDFSCVNYVDNQGVDSLIQVKSKKFIL